MVNLGALEIIGNNIVNGVNTSRALKGLMSSTASSPWYSEVATLNRTVHIK